MLRDIAQSRLASSRTNTEAELSVASVFESGRSLRNCKRQDRPVGPLGILHHRSPWRLLGFVYQWRRNMRHEILDTGRAD